MGNLYLNINQLDALNFIMSLFHASTCFEHTCSSSGGQIYKIIYKNYKIIKLVNIKINILRCTVSKISKNGESYYLRSLTRNFICPAESNEKFVVKELST